MTDLDDKLVETATKVTTSINEYGDRVFGGTSTSACLYRDISTKEHLANRDNIRYDGILWFGADEDAKRGDIYNHQDIGYVQIETVTRAKTLLTDNAVKFIKCLVTKQRQIS